jgi:hypothetical protein
MDPKPLPKAATKSYGNRRFYAPAVVDVSLLGVLCNSCLDELGGLSASLHRECAARLRAALGEVIGGNTPEK